MPAKYARIIETDNFCGDYPDEKFVDLPPMTESQAQRIVEAINKELCNDDRARRIWKVVDNYYELRPGFEP